MEKIHRRQSFCKEVNKGTSNQILLKMSKARMSSNFGAVVTVALLLVLSALVDARDAPPSFDGIYSLIQDGNSFHIEMSMDPNGLAWWVLWFVEYCSLVGCTVPFVLLSSSIFCLWSGCWQHRKCLSFRVASFVIRLLYLKMRFFAMRCSPDSNENIFETPSGLLIATRWTRPDGPSWTSPPTLKSKTNSKPTPLDTWRFVLESSLENWLVFFPFPSSVSLSNYS